MEQNGLSRRPAAGKRSILAAPSGNDSIDSLGCFQIPDSVPAATAKAVFRRTYHAARQIRSPEIPVKHQPRSCVATFTPALSGTARATRFALARIGRVDALPLNDSACESLMEETIASMAAAICITRLRGFRMACRIGTFQTFVRRQRPRAQATKPTTPQAASTALAGSGTLGAAPLPASRPSNG